MIFKCFNDTNRNVSGLLPKTFCHSCWECFLCAQRNILMKLDFLEIYSILNLSKTFRARFSAFCQKFLPEFSRMASMIPEKHFEIKQLHVVCFCFPTISDISGHKYISLFWRWTKTFSHSVWKLSVVGQICNLHVQRKLLCEKCF